MSKQEKNSRQKVLAGKFCIGYQSKLSNYKDIFLESCFEKGSAGILKSLDGQKNAHGY
jgi:hypothetical protein